MKLVIIGNGVAGVTCALEVRARDADVEITMIGGETEYFFSRTALMYSYMDAMTRQDLEPYERGVYEKKKIRLVYDWVRDIDHAARTVQTAAGESIAWDKLVIACGAAARMIDWPGADAASSGIVHFVSMQDLDRCEALTPSTRTAVVVGGGLVGVELVECLRHHGVEVHFLVREPYYWPAALAEEESEFVQQHMREHGVHVHLEEELDEIQSDSDGRVSSITTSAGARIECQMLGVSIGVTANIDWLATVNDAPEVDRGILVDTQFRTSLEDVFAIGDCMQMQLSDANDLLIETIWYSARRHGRYAARNVFGDGIIYVPPVFYNSSKFFDIEFTTVGDVTSAPAGTPTIYLRHPNKYQSVRIVHDGEKVIGFNMLGSSWDHTMLVRWVEERRAPEWVFDRLKTAQFDVEFGRAPLEDFVRHDIPLRPLEK